MVQVLLLGTVAALSAGGFVWLRPRGASGPESQSWRCPRCARKLRYSPRLAGRPAVCPGCKRRLTLPDAPGAAAQAAPAAKFRVGRR